MEQSHHLSQIEHPGYNCSRWGMGRIGPLDISTAPNDNPLGSVKYMVSWGGEINIFYQPIH